MPLRDYWISERSLSFVCKCTYAPFFLAFWFVSSGYVTVVSKRVFFFCLLIFLDTLNLSFEWTLKLKVGTTESNQYNQTHVIIFKDILCKAVIPSLFHTLTDLLQRLLPIQSPLTDRVWVDHRRPRWWERGCSVGVFDSLIAQSLVFPSGTADTLMIWAQDFIYGTVIKLYLK